MNFDFGEVLTRAGQITWKHKNLWLAGILLALVSFLSAPISLVFNPSSLRDPSAVNQQLPIILLANGLILLVSLLSIPVTVMAMSIPSLGTVQLEKGNQTLNFRELIRSALPYFWRILAVFLVVWVGVILVAMALAGCIILVSLLTLGIGALCALPIIILFIPLAMFVYAIMEQGMAAILVDDLGVSAAIQRAWELFKKNPGVMALMSIIIYLGSMIVSMIISLPMMIPIFGFIFNMGAEPDMEAFETLSRNMVLWMLAFSPLYAVFQGILLTFMQSAWTLTYMRLTRSTNPSQPLPKIAEATS